MRTSEKRHPRNRAEADFFLVKEEWVLDREDFVGRASFLDDEDRSFIGGNFEGRNVLLCFQDSKTHKGDTVGGFMGW